MLGGNLDSLLAHLEGSHMDRGAGRDRLAAAVSPHPVQDSAGVTAHDRHVFGFDAKVLRANLGESGLGALAHGHGPG